MGSLFCERDIAPAPPKIAAFGAPADRNHLPMTAPCSAKVQARAQVQQRRSTRVVVTAALADNRLATGFAAAALAAAVLINAPMAKADLVS